MEYLPGVETDVRIAHHQWIGGKAFVEQRVRHDEGTMVRGQNRMRAEGTVTARFEGVDPHPRLEPLPICVDHAYQGNRHIQNQGRHAGDSIEALLRSGVENSEPVERSNPVDLVRVVGCTHHLLPIDQ